MNKMNTYPGGPRRLPQRIVLLAVVTSFVVVILALGVISMMIDRTSALERAERNAETLVSLLLEHAEATLDNAQLMLAYLAHVIAKGNDPAELGFWISDWTEVQDFTWEDVQNYARAMPQLGTIWVFGPDGEVLFASAATPPPPDELPELSYFRTTGTRAQGVFIGRLRQEPDGAFFTISKGVEMSAGTGIVTAAISAQSFNEFYRNLDLPGQSFVALAYGDGAVVATPWPSRVPDGTLAPEIVAPANDGLRWLNIDGGSYVVKWQRVRHGGLSVLAALSKEDVLQSWYASLQRNGLLGLAAAVILAAITLVALASLRREEQSRTDLDRALREKEMLFKELHHRVKNNLQVVTSLITMQSLRFTQPELQDSFHQTMDRVRAMGLVHELLYQQERSERLEFNNYLSALISTLAESHGAAGRAIAVDCYADPGTVDLNTAIPAGLIVNELLTNALKYAFPEGHGGHVEVAFTRRDGLCSLTVADDGCGSIPGEQARGTGLGTMIVTNLARQLSASYRVETKPGAGTRVSLTFPCPS